MELKSNLSRLRSLIKEGDIEVAIDALVALAQESGNKEATKNALVLSSRFHRAKKEGILNLEDSGTIIHHCARACLEILDEIEGTSTPESPIHGYPFNSFFGKIKADSPLSLTGKDNELQTKAILLASYELSGDLNNLINGNLDYEFYNSPPFKRWIMNKRKFSKSELVRGTIVKISNTGNSHIVHLLEDGTLEEFNIHTTMSSQTTSHQANSEHLKGYWGGKWQINEGVLRMQIGQWELDVFANKSGLLHSGIEFATKERRVWFHSVFLIPFKEFSTFNWEHL